MQNSFCFWVCGWISAFRGLMTGIFGILESSATQRYQDVVPNQELFFHRQIYSLWPDAARQIFAGTSATLRPADSSHIVQRVMTWPFPLLTYVVRAIRDRTCARWVPLSTSFFCSKWLGSCYAHHKCVPGHHIRLCALIDASERECH
jgi:hypothetical protein